MDVNHFRLYYNPYLIHSILQLVAYFGHQLIFFSYFFHHQIRESNWLSGVAWPEGDNKFRKLPNLQQPDLGPVEMKTRQVLQEIGIESTLLESHVEQGARSHVIGAFRIIQNK